MPGRLCGLPTNLQGLAHRPPWCGRRCLGLWCRADPDQHLRLCLPPAEATHDFATGVNLDHVGQRAGGQRRLVHSSNTVDSTSPHPSVFSLLSS